MAETNKNVDVLQSFIAQPTSLEQERAGKRFFLDSHSKVIPNEGNLLSLMTLIQFYATDAKRTKLFDDIAQEENRYLLSAMDMLQGDKSGDTKAEDVQKKLRSKFGSDFDSALSLAGLLKSKSDEKAFDQLIDPAITKLADTTLDRSKGIFR